MNHPSVSFGSILLGEGMPKVCIPVMGQNIPEITSNAEKAKSANADIIEFRADSISECPETAAVLQALAAVREASCRLPLLFTFRTKRDGGPGTDNPTFYTALLNAVCNAKAADGIDIELSAGESVFSDLVFTAHKNGIRVVGSSHEFGTVSSPELPALWMQRQQELGADICKAAVMGHSVPESLLLSAKMAEGAEKLTVPHIAIVMGKDGILSRTACEYFGSCLTFGTASGVSAPGQIDSLHLKRILEQYHQVL